MQLILIVLLMLMALLLWFLVAPLVITIDSIQQRYELRWKSIGFVRIILVKEPILLKFRIFFFHKTINVDPFKISKAKRKIIKKVEKKKKKAVDWTKMQRKAKRVFKSFRLEKLWLNMDTDSYYYNAFLFPLFYFIKGRNYHLRINYQGKNELCLILKNRPIRMLYALIF
ncbi:MAG: hypothetical protein ACI8P3_002241 [Saprospiraceae bacterium]